MSPLLLKTLIQLIPQIISLVKLANERLKQGAKIDEIKRAFEKIDEAFKLDDRAEGSRRLNNLWNNPDDK